MQMAIATLNANVMFGTKYTALGSYIALAVLHVYPFVCDYCVHVGTKVSGAATCNTTKEAKPQPRLLPCV